MQAWQEHGIADFAFRVGLHTGSVALGAGVEADNTAMGAAVNIAARMEQSAAAGHAAHQPRHLEPGARAVRHAGAAAACRSRASKRRCRPTWCAPRSSAAAASVERGLQGLATPMVGRDAELQRLLQTVAQARQTRQLQALTLLGDAGLGKSRLLRELKAGAGSGAAASSRCARSPTACCARGACCAACWPRSAAWPTPTAPRWPRRKVVEGLSPCFDERGERQAQLIGQLSGLDFGDSPHVRGLDPRSLRDQAFNALRAYLQSLARDGAACRCCWSKTCTGPTTARWTCCST
jgi:hypothetical protein